MSITSNTDDDKARYGGSMRVTTKGQVTIPLEIRRMLNIVPGTEVEFVISEDENVYLIKKSDPDVPGRFTALRGIATVHLTTEEIMAMTRSDT
ncbi:MAG: AbrB/MazE/SpoVT family DNA-binding domain-containing protein [Anaerolineales bacterium]|nr:AbrB/MazE/SpoVT family DNA-binding domain-containing protein [Anaerolineales bacterium]